MAQPLGLIRQGVRAAGSRPAQHFHREGLSRRARWGRRVHLVLVLAIAALASMLVFPTLASALEQKLTAADGATGDRLGTSVAIDGDTAVVGAPPADGERGAVYVYQRTGNAWTQTAKLTASDGVARDPNEQNNRGDMLGSSVAIDGDTIVAGASEDDGADDGEGSVYTFSRTGSPARTQTAKLTASDPQRFENLGSSVAIDGDTIVAGSPAATIDGNTASGAAFTFARTGAAQRTETGVLTASDGGQQENLGSSVAIDGDTIVAGAQNVDNGGAVYTFARTGPTPRAHTAKLTATDRMNSDLLGNSVAIDGATIVAGAPQASVGGVRKGAAYTFARTGSPARSQTAKLTAADPKEFQGLGSSVAIDGDAIVAGAPFAAAIYGFASTGPASRTQIVKLTAADGAPVGESVAIDGTTIVAGAPSDTIGGRAGQGSASVFSPGSPLPPPPPNYYPPPSTNNCPPGTSGGVSCQPLPGGGRRITGTAGNDRIVGTNANDDIVCGDGDDIVQGGAGNDVIRCGDGRDRISGDAGNDRIFGEAGNDRMSGDSGNDSLSGGTGNDRGLGASGRDRLNGNRGDDVLHGDSGNDSISGSGGRDRISGNSGNDRVSGNSGNDRISGDSGNDRITGGSGRDRLSGASGNDSISARDRQRDSVSCSRGRDRVSADRIDRVSRTCERVRRRR